MLLKSNRTEACRALIRIRFVAKAVSYRLSLPVTKVFQLHDGSCFPICPRCSISMEREYMAFCDRCGQRLSWYVFECAEVCCPEISKKI